MHHHPIASFVRFSAYTCTSQTTVYVLLIEGEAHRRDGGGGRSGARAAVRRAARVRSRARRRVRHAGRLGPERCAFRSIAPLFPYEYIPYWDILYNVNVLYLNISLFLCADEVMQDEGPESCSASEDSDGQDVSDDNDEQSDALEMDEESGEDDKAAFDSEERDSDEEARDESHSCRSSSRDDRVDAKSSATASSATLSVAQRVARARAVSSTRLLTAADFERIRAHQSGKLARLTVSTRAARIRNDSAADGEAHDSKRSREDSDAEEPEQLVALPQPTCALIE